MHGYFGLIRCITVVVVSGILFVQTSWMDGNDSKWEGFKHGIDNPETAVLDLRKGSSEGFFGEKFTFCQTIPKWPKSGFGVI